MSVRVKICGVTRANDAVAAVESGADLIGLNFYPPSPRCITIEIARDIVRALDGRARTVGVFVNAARAYIDERRRALALDLLQFHGDEDDDALALWPVPIIRAIRLKRVAPAAVAAPPHRGYLLLDSHHPALFGGTGNALALDALRTLDLSRVFISGGLHPGNVGAAASLKPYGVDAASGIESAPGIKDHDKLRSFIANAKSSR